jgi:hypothetical protein
MGEERNPGIGPGGWLKELENRLQKVGARLEDAALQLARSSSQRAEVGRHLSALLGAARRETLAPEPRDSGASCGADGRIRTGDLLITNQLLYQLSYVGADRSLSPKPARCGRDEARATLAPGYGARQGRRGVAGGRPYP